MVLTNVWNCVIGSPSPCCPADQCLYPIGHAARVAAVVLAGNAMSLLTCNAAIEEQWLVTDEHDNCLVSSGTSLAAGDCMLADGKTQLSNCLRVSHLS